MKHLHRIKKASLHLKQAFLEIFLPTNRKEYWGLRIILGTPDVQGASVAPSLIKADCTLAPSHFVQFCLRKIVQWGQLSTFLCHSRQPSTLFIYSSSQKKFNLWQLANQPWTAKLPYTMASFWFSFIETTPS